MAEVTIDLTLYVLNIFEVKIIPEARQWTFVFQIANTMAVDDWVTQGARASAAMVLSQLSHKIMVSAPEGLIYWDPDKVKVILKTWFIPLPNFYMIIGCFI